MKKIVSLILCTLLLISLVGCAASDKSELIDIESNIAGDSLDGMFGSSVTPEQDYITNDKTDVENNTSSTEDYLKTQKLIYFCKIDIETLEFETTTSTVKSLIDQYGGFIESDIMNDDSWNWYYESYEKTYASLNEVITIRIPSEKYNDFLNEINGIAKIKNKTETVTNITKKYNDTKTTIEMYEKEEAMLLAMMDQATSITDMITIEERLAEVQRNLALHQSSMSTMETDLAFSTITMSITEVMKYTQKEQEVSFGERFISSIKESWCNFVSFTEDFVILMVHLLPFLIIGSIVLVIVLRIIKLRKNKVAKQATIQIGESNNSKNKDITQK